MASWSRSWKIILFAALLLVSTAIVLAACGGDDKKETAEPAAAAMVQVHELATNSCASKAADMEPQLRCPSHHIQEGGGRFSQSGASVASTGPRIRK